MAPTTTGSATTAATKPVREGNNARDTRAESSAGRGTYLTDDEILGLVSDAMARDREQSRQTEGDSTANARNRKNARAANPANSDYDESNGASEIEANIASGQDNGEAGASQAANDVENAVPEKLRAAMEENPELRQAWQEARDFRESFATPQAAQEATTLLGDLNRLDALFFSRRPEDHAELARTVAQLDPAAFASLARAMAAVAGENDASATKNGHVPDPAAEQNAAANASPPANANVSQQSKSNDATNESKHAADTAGAPEGLTPAQAEFFHATNASAVEGVLEAIESQLDRLLPENMPARARTRVVGEVYRELDAALRGNRQFAEQLRRAFRSGALDAGHERAIVSLVTRQSRQALPGVAKRVLNEWTSALVTANAERRERQRSAERRVDIAGSGGAGRETRRAASPRDIDYARMSDADILNL